MPAVFGSRIMARGQSKRFTAFTLLALLVLSCVGLVYSAQGFRDRIDAVRSSDSDNAGWLISQLDVDQKSLLLAIDRTLLSDKFPDLDETVTDLSQVRLRFDIFYSRVNTVLASLAREDISEDLRLRIGELRKIRDSLAHTIDALQDGDTAGLVLFANSVLATSATVRDVTTMALFHHVSQSDLVRDMERSLLKRFWFQSIVLLGLMSVSAALAIRLWHEIEDRSARMQRAMDTVAKVFGVSHSAIVVTDMHGRILMANPSAATVFGVSAQNMVGQCIEEVMIPAEQREYHRQMMARHRNEGHRKTVDAGPLRMDAVRMDGKSFKAEISIVADSDLDGKPILIGFIRDISEMVAAEEKLMVARDEAQKHASAKTMFLATMSHEMRTPLHGVIASLDLIEDQGMSEETQLLLQTARDCSDRALQQVNDVLEITRLGESKLGQVPFSPISAARDILRELGPIAAARQISLDLTVTGANPDELYLGLANAFSRALYNLAGNAVKFTDVGGVEIVLRFTPVSRSQVKLCVEVKDSGIGIAAEDQSRIFAEFETVDSVSRFRGSGTGLGLPIVRLAVSRMGGQLSLHSKQGTGSIFSFEISLPVADAAFDNASKPALNEMRTVAPVAPADALDVLVVDDNAVNVTLMHKMVARMGHRVDDAKHGQEAVSMASSKAYDVILMDVSMPVMDGKVATGHIRRGTLSSKAVIIGVTAFSDEGRLGDLVANGMNDVLTKPVNTSELSSAITQALTGRKAAAIPVNKGGDDLAQAFTQLQELLGYDTALRFLGQALEDVATNLPVLQDRSMSKEQMADRIHSSVGSTAVVGLLQLSGLLAQAESAARSGNTADLEHSHSQIAQRLIVERGLLGALGNAA